MSTENQSRRLGRESCGKEVYETEGTAKDEKRILKQVQDDGGKEMGLVARAPPPPACGWRSPSPSELREDLLGRLAGSLEHRLEVLAGITPRLRRHLLRRPLRHDLPAAHAALGPQVEHPVRRLDHVEV